MPPIVMIRLLFLTILCVSQLCGGAEPQPIPGWKLVWQDEFDGEKLNSAVWSRCKRGKSDWNNTMSDSPALLSVKNGVLQLRGVSNPDRSKDPAPYLTAGVTSKGKYSFLYGKVVIRARFKNAQGAWPALWMLGEKGRHPFNGEIDIMEHLNFDPYVYQTIHSPFTKDPMGAEAPAKSARAKIEKDKWNTYGCEWSADKVVFTVNGKVSHTYPRKPELGKRQWPFTQPFYFIFSMQVGGGWVNAKHRGPTKASDFPAHMEVDWVRVYQKSK